MGRFISKCESVNGDILSVMHTIGVKSQPSVPRQIMTRSQTGTAIRPPDRL